MAKRKKKELTGLAAALVNAGHMGDKQARKLQRENKRELKQLSPEEIAAQKQEALAKAEARAHETMEQKNAAARTEASQALRRAVRSEAAAGWEGRRRWFYVRRDQRLSFFDVSDEIARLLRSGQVAVVEGFDEDEGQHFLLKDPLLVGKVKVEDPTRVRFWNQAELSG